MCAWCTLAATACLGTPALHILKYRASSGCSLTGTVFASAESVLRSDSSDEERDCWLSEVYASSRSGSTPYRVAMSDEAGIGSIVSGTGYLKFHL